MPLQSRHFGPPITTFEGRLDLESGHFYLDSRFGGNDGIKKIAKMRWRDYPIPLKLTHLPSTILEKEKNHER